MKKMKKVKLKKLMHNEHPTIKKIINNMAKNTMIKGIITLHTKGRTISKRISGIKVQGIIKEITNIRIIEEMIIITITTIIRKRITITKINSMIGTKDQEAGLEISTRINHIKNIIIKIIKISSIRIIIIIINHIIQIINIKKALKPKDFNMIKNRHKRKNYELMILKRHTLSL